MENSQEMKFDETKSTILPFDPLLDAAPKVHDYSKVVVQEGHEVTFIDEPSFNPPPLSFDEETQIDYGNNDSDNKTTSAPEAERPLNPDYTELSDREKTAGAELAADSILGGYKLLKEKGLGGLAKIKESKVEQLIATGDLDATLQIPIDDEGTEVGVRDFVKEFNTSAQDAFSVSAEFVDEVRPVMIRVLKKKGLAMTDEQFLMVAFGKDIITSGAIAFSLMRTGSTIIKNLSEQTKQNATHTKSQKQSQEATEQETNNAETSKAHTYQDPVIVKTDLEFDMPKVEYPEFIITQSEMPEMGNKAILEHMTESIKSGKSTRVKKNNGNGRAAKGSK